jgi:hypothetical protein
MEHAHGAIFVHNTMVKRKGFFAGKAAFDHPIYRVAVVGMHLL